MTMLPFPLPAADQMRATTVIQPWAWTIAHGGMNLVVLTSPTAHRGPLLIHADSNDRWDRMAQFDGRVTRAWRLHSRQGQFTGEPVSALFPEARQIVYSAVIAVTIPTDCHRATGRCCPTWSAPAWSSPDGYHPDGYHLTLQHTVPLPDPVPCRPHPDVTWEPLPEVATLVTEQLRALPVSTPQNGTR